MGIFLVKAFSFSITPPLKFSLILRQIDFIGFQSMSVILLTGVFTALVLGYRGYSSLSRCGSGAFLGPMVGVALIKELVPVI